MSGSKNAGDNINTNLSSWDFGGKTPISFDSHISKSVPGYEEGQLLIESSPFYEKTFQEKTTIFDYLLKNHKVVLNRNSGIHAYQMPLRKLFGQKKSRPISSGYFDLIQTKID